MVAQCARMFDHPPRRIRVVEGWVERTDTPLACTFALEGCEEVLAKVERREHEETCPHKEERAVGRHKVRIRIKARWGGKKYLLNVNPEHKIRTRCQME